MALAWIDRHLDIQHDDPDVRRKGRLLNILLLGFVLITSLVMLIGLLLVFSGFSIFFDPTEVIIWSGVFILSALMVGVINYRWSTSVASMLFLMTITLILFFGELPFQSVWLHSLSLLVIPVVIASMIMHPYSSFIMAAIISFLVIMGARWQQVPPNPVAIPGYFAVAYVSWLLANSLQNALVELRQLNTELDTRVITRTRELQLSNEQLRFARDKALEANRFKSELTARVSHELRTPLGSILGFSEMLRAGYYGPLTDKQKEPINKIIETDMELTEMINDLLDQARLESGKMSLDCTTFQTQNLMNNIRDLMLVLAHNKGLELSCKITAGAPKEIYNDELRLQQILVNLVGNAIKFTDHGRVTITFTGKDEDHWLIEVSDSGRGIPEAALPHIFETFQQVDGSAAREFSGSGLGLSIVEQLVQLMNGDVLVESKVNEGTTFTVILPAVLQDMEIENG